MRLQCKIFFPFNLHIGNAVTTMFVFGFTAILIEFKTESKGGVVFLYILKFGGLI
jgi:hypothetical protein